MFKLKSVFLLSSAIALSQVAFAQSDPASQKSKTPVDYVNPYMGNISHLLVPTFPTVHLPNSMLRVYPERNDFTTDQLRGLPLVVTSHRGRSAFNLSPVNSQQQESWKNVYPYAYDNEEIKPYYYGVSLLDEQIDVQYAPSHQSGIYALNFLLGKDKSVVFNSGSGSVRVKGNSITASQQLQNNTTVYLYGEFDQKATASGVLENGKLVTKKTEVSGKQAAVVLMFAKGDQPLHFRYGISFIDAEQAKRNLQREISHFDVQRVADTGRDVWNESLSTVQVAGGKADDRAVFYTSLYRCFERPVNISEDNRYFSAFDGKVHTDSRPFYTDDWIWDTYRATHPLRLLIDEKVESDVLQSYVRMAEQMDQFWMPTFPEITGDSRRMNSNHGVVTIADAYAKGLRSFDIEKAYESGKRAVQEKTLAPWSAAPAGWLDDFYKEHGYIPALYPGEEETVPEVHRFERRQPIAVTLGTSYDEWALGRLAQALGHTTDADLFLKNALNYRNLYNAETKFFHPKDKEGKFIMPFDYRYDGGQGAREYYGENNGWVYRWDVPHNVSDLISLMGGKEQFNYELDRTFREPLGKSKFEFYSQLPDHTGNVGQFSMANEPSLHIPYLYNYSGKPWMSQKRIDDLIHQWFRNDLMGMPGDEDGGGMSAFLVFSMAGFYPVTPGIPVYTIGTPFFENITMKLSNGKEFTIRANGRSAKNKYIQSATLNGKTWNKPWFTHQELAQGGVLEFQMGDRPNRDWGADAPPPSFQMP